MHRKQGKNETVLNIWCVCLAGENMIYDDFINLKYEPEKNDLIALFYIEPNKRKGINLRRAAGAVADESSVGTWAENTMMKKYLKFIS